MCIYPLHLPPSLTIYLLLHIPSSLTPYLAHSPAPLTPHPSCLNSYPSSPSLDPPFLTLNRHTSPLLYCITPYPTPFLPNTS